MIVRILPLIVTLLACINVSQAQITESEVKQCLEKSRSLFLSGDTLCALLEINTLEDENFTSVSDTVLWSYYDQAAALNNLCKLYDNSLRYLNLIIPLHERKFKIETPYYYKLQSVRFRTEYRLGYYDDALKHLQELLVKCATTLADPQFQEELEDLSKFLDDLYQRQGIEL